MKRVTVSLYVEDTYAELKHTKNELIQNAVDTAIEKGLRVVAVTGKVGRVKKVAQP